MADTYEAALLIVVDEYTSSVGTHGGKSLARVATIVCNRGSFFDGLRNGATITASNLDRVTAWFRDPANWPQGRVPEAARLALKSVGRPVLASDIVIPPVGNGDTSDAGSLSERNEDEFTPLDVELPLRGSYREPELPVIGVAA